jgi:hypothetical protein
MREENRCRERRFFLTNSLQLREEAQKPLKTELGQKLALERIEKRVNGMCSDTKCM